MKHRRLGCLTGLGVAALLVAVFLWWVLFSEFMAVDRCLDAGGVWADAGYCDEARVGE